jgi:hypothetical protein
LICRPGLPLERSRSRLACQPENHRSERTDCVDIGRRPGLRAQFNAHVSGSNARGDLHLDELAQVGKTVRRSKSMVLRALHVSLGRVNLRDVTRYRLIEFGKKRAAQGAGSATLAIDSLSYEPSYCTLRRSAASTFLSRAFSWPELRLDTSTSWKNLTTAIAVPLRTN